MKPLALLTPLVLGTLILSVAGCGGHEGGTQTIYSITPTRATVALRGSVGLAADTVEGTFSSIEFSVREGSAGGTVTSPGTGRAIYTAPTTDGTYHVRARFLNGTDVVATRTATITVRDGG